MEDHLCFGDFVSLYADERGGFVFANHSSSFFNEVAVSRERNKPVNENVLTFEICPPTRYQFSNHYRDLLNSQSEKVQNDSSSSKPINQAVFEAEQSFNSAEIKRQRGRPVCFGQTIQFRHKFTRKFIQVSTSSTSNLEKENRGVTIETGDSINGQFKILSKLKYRKEGDRVNLFERVVFESISCPSNYLHVSEDIFNHDQKAYNKEYELNMSTSPSTFSISRNSTPLVDGETKLKNGDVIRFFHNEKQGYLVAEGSFGRRIKEDVHLRLRPLNRDRPHSLQPSTSAITYWQVELVNNDSDGIDCYIKQSSTIRLLHLCTHQFMCLETSGNVTLTPNPEDIKAQFKLVSVESGDNILFRSSYSIEHIQTGNWIQATADTYKKLQKDHAGSRPLEALPISLATLKRVCPSDSKSGGNFNDKQFEDLLVLEKVDESDYMQYTFVAGMVPYMFKNEVVTAQDNTVISRNILKCFNEMISFMAVNDKPVKARQKLFRNLGIIDRMLEILEGNLQPQNVHMCKVFALVYDVLGAYGRGSSRKNKTHVARQMSRYFSHFQHHEGQIHQHAVDMVNEFIQDNIVVVEKITNDDMTKLVDFTRRDKEYRFLQLMGNFCVCQNKAVMDNQNYITNAWLRSETTNCLFFTKMGHEIGKSAKDEVFVTVNNARDWIKLVELTKDTTKKADCQFFYHQLRTFERLCYGRNEKAIETLANELKYFTTEEAAKCLRDTNLPEDLRALYCQLIIAVYVNTKANQDMVRPIEELYLYNLHSDLLGSENNNNRVSQPFLEELYTFVNDYISEMSIQTSVKIETNKLTAQVLCLLNHLTLLGFRQESRDTTTINHLVELLNGKTDAPERAMESEIQTYRQGDRFKRSDCTAAIAETKIQCILVLETYFDHVLRTRLKAMVKEFSEIKKPSLQGSSVADMIDPEIEPVDYQRFAGEARYIIETVFQETALFSGLELPTIMVDLTKYDYERLVTKTMETFHTYFSALQTLIKHARKIQVITKVTSQTLVTYGSVRMDLLSMKRKMESKMSDAALKEISSTMKKITRHCELKKGIPHTTLQNIFFSQGLVDDILTLLTSNELQDIDANPIQNKALKLLKILTYRNEQIQGHVFTKLDFLLKMIKLRSLVFPVVKAVFEGNIHTCKQVNDRQIHVIVKCLLEDIYPQALLFGILQTIIKPDEHRVPLRRNQNLVMRHMGEIRARASRMFGLDEYSLMKGIGEQDKEVSFFLETVNLMASCAQKGSEESKISLRSVLDVPLLLKIVTMSGLPIQVKRPFLRTFTFAYCEQLHVADDNTWLTTEKTKIETLLKNIASGWGSMSDDMLTKLKSDSEILHTRDESDPVLYQFDTIVPFCQCFCTCIPIAKIADSTQKVMKNLCEEFMKFLDKISEFKLPSTLRTQLIGCMKSMKTFVSWKEDTGELEKKYSSDIIETDITEYDKEKETNQQFQTFVRNLTLAAEGIPRPVEQTWNVIKKSKLEHANLALKKDLSPLHEHFVGSDVKPVTQAFKLTEKIIMELKDVKSVKLHGELVFPKPELHRKYMQALQAILLKEIIKLPTNFGVYTLRNKRQLDRLSQIQMTLVNYGAIDCALQDLSPHLANCHLKESLHLLNYLLFNGNLHSQDTIFSFFLQRPDVLVIPTLQSKIACFKDFAMETESNRKQILDSQPDQPEIPNEKFEPPSSQMPEGTDEADGALPSSSGDMRNDIPLVTIHHTEDIKPKRFGFGSNRVSPNLETNKKGKVNQEIVLSELERETIETTSLILEFISSLCQNQHTQLQDYFREQAPIELSTNCVDILVDVIDTVYIRINSRIVDVVVQTFDCLAKIVSGNTKNKSLVLHTRVCEQTNFMLFTDEYGDSSPGQIYKLKKSIGIFLRAMTEETCVVQTTGGDSTADLASTAIEYLDSEVVLQVMQHASRDQTKRGCRKIRSLVRSVGFQYCLLLERKLFKFPTLSIHDILKTEDDKTVFETYSESTRSVELLKDDTLHKVFFRVKDKNAFSTDIRERIKYDVNRSSPVEKIKDFMQWSRDTTDYARNRWHICNSPIGKMLVYSWLPFNYLMLLITLAILVMIGIDYGAGERSSRRYETERDPKVGIAVFALGGVHNFLSLFIVVSFVLLNEPQFHSLIHIFQVTRFAIQDKQINMKKVEEQMMERKESRLKVNAYGPKMIYYILFLAASVCGTALHGFTFALCLFQIVELNQHLKRICRSVLYNGRYLLMVVLLGLFILYIYGMIAFLFLRETYIRNEDGRYCNSMPQCFVTILHHGLVGTAYQMFDHSTTSSFTAAVLIGLYNVSFFVIITILGLYIILAIIVDGFMFFKQKMRSANADFGAMCFICGRPNADFSVAAKGYDDHVMGDHNIWDYIYFFIHIDTTVTTDYSALENFVYQKMSEGKYDFLPIGRAVCLEEADKTREKQLRSADIVDSSKDNLVTGQRRKLKKHPSFRETKNKEKKNSRKDEARQPFDKKPTKPKDEKPERNVMNPRKKSEVNVPYKPVDDQPMDQEQESKKQRRKSEVPGMERKTKGPGKQPQSEVKDPHQASEDKEEDVAENYEDDFHPLEQPKETVGEAEPSEDKSGVDVNAVPQHPVEV